MIILPKPPDDPDNPLLDQLAEKGVLRKRTDPATGKSTYIVAERQTEQQYVEAVERLMSAMHWYKERHRVADELLRAKLKLSND